MWYRLQTNKIGWGGRRTSFYIMGVSERTAYVGRSLHLHLCRRRFFVDRRRARDELFLLLVGDFFERSFFCLRGEVSRDETGEHQKPEQDEPKKITSEQRSRGYDRKGSIHESHRFPNTLEIGCGIKYFEFENDLGDDSAEFS